MICCAERSGDGEGATPLLCSYLCPRHPGKFLLNVSFFPGPLPCRRLIFCSGKVFYELHAEREKQGLHKDNQIALVRLEQVMSCVLRKEGRLAVVASAGGY